MLLCGFLVVDTDSPLLFTTCLVFSTDKVTLYGYQNYENPLRFFGFGLVKDGLKRNRASHLYQYLHIRLVSEEPMPNGNVVLVNVIFLEFTSTVA